MSQHAALYLRLSQLADGRTDGIEAQKRQALAYAAEHWPGMPTKTYTDAGKSAANADVSREGFDRLRKSIGAGLVSHIWAANQSRLSRQTTGPDSWFTVAAELTEAGLKLDTRDEGIVNPADVVSDIRAVLNASYVRELKQKVHARLDDNAAQGQPSGGMPYGYRHDTVVISGRKVKTYRVVESEAAAIRLAADRLLAGWSLAKIARTLNGHNESCPKRCTVLHEGRLTGHKVRHLRDADGEFIIGADGEHVTRTTELSPISVRSWLTNAAVAGFRLHRGQIIGRGNWEPILDEPTWRACQARLASVRTITKPDGSTQTVTGKHSGTGTRYLLTGGVARCGVCGHAMIAAEQQRVTKAGKRSVPTYICHPVNGGCSRLAAMAEPVEQLVTDALMAELDKPEFLAMVVSDDHKARRDQITRELSTFDSQRAELGAMWTRREIDSAMLTGAKTELDRIEQDLQTELATIPAPPVVASIASCRADWDQMAIGERRQIIGLFIESVTIAKARPGANSFDPSRVSISWKAGS